MILVRKYTRETFLAHNSQVVTLGRVIEVYPNIGFMEAEILDKGGGD